MSLEFLFPYLSIGIILACFLALVLTHKEPEIIFACGLLLMMLTGILPVELALSGFSSAGLITVACLFVLAAAMKEAGLIQPLIAKLANGSESPRYALARILFPVSFFSAFLNNTPIVAALIPGIRNWCRGKKDQAKWNKKRFLLPLSYAAVLGGTCTMIGTSTNVLVFGFLISDGLQSELSFFSIGLIGVPLTLVGLGYLLLFSGKLIKVPAQALDPVRNTREYTVEMIVESHSQLIGQSVENAKLRHLKGLYLVEIIRNKLILPVVSSETLLEPGDRLIFTGLVSSISELIAIEGIHPAEDRVFKLQDDIGQAKLIETIVGPHHELIGCSIRACGFRRKYNASVLAVLREGERIVEKVGDIKLKAGDTLLLIAKRSFVDKYEHSRELLIVNRGQSIKVINKQKIFKAAVITFLFVFLAITELVQIAEAAILTAILMILTGCISLEKAKKSLDLQVLFTIGAAFGLGAGLKESGGAELIASSILSISGNNPLALLVATYLLTMILTELVTNNAAAVIAYSLVSGIVSSLDYNMVPFAIAIMIAASASFISPLGYQTNLMVYSAGRYRLTDYLKLGIPLSVIAMGLTLFIVPKAWNLN